MANKNFEVKNGLSVAGTERISSAGVGTFTDLNVTGTTTTLDTTTLQVQDKNIVLNYGTGDTSSTASGAGITIQDAVDSSTDATLLWDASADKFVFSHPINSASYIEATGNISTGANGGRLRAGASNEIQLYFDGSHGHLSNSTGNFTVDVAGNIILDADGAIWQFKDGGTEIFQINSGSQNANLKSTVQDKDIRLQGNDGGSTVTALTLDMSEAGKATFNSGVGVGTTPGDFFDVLGSNATVDLGEDNSGEIVAGFVPDSTNDRNGRLRIVGTDKPHSNSIALVSDSSTNVGMSFVTTSSGARGERMVITSDGNVGIAHTNPSYALEVKKSVNSNWVSRIYNTSGTDGSGLLVRSDTANSQATTIFGVYGGGSYKMYVKGDGTVLQPEQPTAVYTHVNNNEAGAYNYNFSGSSAVICRPQLAVVNRGSIYNASNGRFTAPQAGIYRYAVHGNLYTVGITSTAYWAMQILKNTSHYLYHYEANSTNAANGWIYVNIAGLISMSAKDYLRFNLLTNGKSGSVNFGWDLNSYTHYEFQLLY